MLFTNYKDNNKKINIQIFECFIKNNYYFYNKNDVYIMFNNKSKLKLY